MTPREKLLALQKAKKAGTNTAPQTQPEPVAPASATAQNLAQTAATARAAAAAALGGTPDASVLSKTASLQRAAEAAKTAAQSSPVAKDFKSGALGRLKAGTGAAQIAAQKPAVPVPTVKPMAAPIDPTPQSPAQITIAQRIAKAKEIGSYDSVFPATPWEESQMEGFDAEAHLTDLRGLEAMLIADEPILPVLMARVHQNLKKYEELVHLLDETQIAVIVNAFAKQKGVEIVAPSKPTKGGRSIQNITKDLTIEQVMGLL